MRLAVLTDLHFGKEERGNFGQRMIDKAAEIKDIDILLFCGDLAEPGPDKDRMLNLRNGLEQISKIKAKHKIMVAGNNDIECLEGHLIDYAAELHYTVADFDFHLLDMEPCTVDGYKFVGNMFWADYSLWKPSDIIGIEPNNLAEIKIEVETRYQNKFKNRTHALKYEELHETLSYKLSEEIFADIENSPEIIVATHYVASKEFCKYNHTSRFDFLNAMMGADKEWIYNHPKIIRGFCGHIHRDVEKIIHGAIVSNISGPGQPYICELE